jgi:hypothetical protein
MSEMLSTFREKAFLGEAVRSEKLINQIDQTAKRVNAILNPIDDIAKKKANGEGAKLVAGLAETGEWKTDRVAELLAAEKDKNRQANQDIAKQRLDILGKGVFVAMRYGENEDLRDVLGMGSAVEIDNVLPESLKGLGERVRSNIIDEPKILEVLDGLDVQRKRNENKGSLGKKTLAGKIEEAYNKLNDLDLESVKEDQREMVMAFLAAEMEMREGEVVQQNQSEKRTRDENDSLPPSKEQQLIIIRHLLEKVESSQRTTRDPYLGQYSAMLEELLNRKEIETGVAIEIRSRLKLHDCAVLMKKANGYIEQPRSGGDPECPNVGSAATLAEGMNHALDTEAINFFLKNGANGLPTSLAWDFYQDINIDYETVLKNIEQSIRQPGKYTGSGLETVVDNDPDMGTIKVNYLTDSDPIRKKAVDQYVVGEIVKQKNVEKDVAEKAWLLGKRLALATGENSVFFAALSGNDQMAESMFLKKYRKGRDKSGRPRGPQIHLEKIVGIGNTWLRRSSGFEPYDNHGVIPLYSKDVVVVPTGDRSKPGIEEQSYVAHFAVWWSGKIHPLRDLLLDRQPDSQKMIGLDFLQSAQDYFNKADPDGKKRLKFWWVMGVLDLACSNGDLGWGQEDISKFRQFLTQRKLSENAGMFLSKNDWDEAMQRGGFASKMLKLDTKRIGQAFMGNMFGTSSGRKK